MVARLIDRLYSRLTWILPRELVYRCGMRILAEVTRRDDLSLVARQVHQGEVRMLWALDTFINAR